MAENNGNSKEVFTQATLDEALQAAKNAGLLSPSGIILEPSDESDYEIRNRIAMEKHEEQRNIIGNTRASSKSHAASVDAQMYSVMGKRWGRR